MTAPVQPGDTLADKFEVERVLGQGGMGVVVVARHRDLDQRVALKFLLPEALGDAETVRRFRQEAKAASRITGEHVARILDVGTMPTGAPYIVMEYLEGQDLHALVQRGGPLSVSDAVDYVLQALEALAEAHAASVVHRDIKPSNMFLTRRADGSPCVKILDFGIAKIKGLGDAATTKTTSLMGSPWYMAPEQLRSTKSVDGRADLWSLGVVLHELVTGSPTFGADTLPQLCTAILMEEPTLQLPPEAAVLEGVIRRCLVKDPAQRYGSAAELSEALAPFAPAHSRVCIERIARLAGAAPSAARETAPPEPTRSILPSAATASTFASTSTGRARGGRGLAIGLGAGAAIVLVGVAALLGRGEPKPPVAAGADPSLTSAAARVVDRAVAPAPRAPAPSALPSASAAPAVSTIASAAPPPTDENRIAPVAPRPTGGSSPHRTTTRPRPAPTDSTSDFGDRK